MYLLTHVVAWQVNDRAESLQHVINHLSVTTLRNAMMTVTHQSVMMKAAWGIRDRRNATAIT